MVRKLKDNGIANQQWMASMPLHKLLIRGGEKNTFWKWFQAPEGHHHVVVLWLLHGMSAILFSYTYLSVTFPSLCVLFALYKGEHQHTHVEERGSLISKEVQKGERTLTYTQGAKTRNRPDQPARGMEPPLMSIQAEAHTQRKHIRTPWDNHSWKTIWAKSHSLGMWARVAQFHWPEGQLDSSTCVEDAVMRKNQMLGSSIASYSYLDALFYACPQSM